jgi:hypothetical protein
VAGRHRSWLAVAVLAATTGAAGATLTGSSPRAAQRAAPAAVVFVTGADRLPDRTASDWVTYADAVVVVTPARETELGPDRIERARGEGLITRRVTLHVDTVLWTRPHQSHAVPESLPWPAFGWLFHGDPGAAGDRVEMAAPGTPRIELGHTYVIAIEREAALCPPGADRIPPRWLGLGADAALPFDDGILGDGEIAGRSPAARVPRAPGDPGFGLADAVTGRGAPALVAALARARPEHNDKATYLPVSAPC